MSNDSRSKNLYDQAERWLPYARRKPMIAHLCRHVGLTRTRAEYFLKLWAYLLVKQQSLAEQSLPEQSSIKRSLNNCSDLAVGQLVPLTEPVSCSHREAARLFYSDREEGSDRAAGMMLDKLAALGLITKFFDGNVTQIEIDLAPHQLEPRSPLATKQTPSLSLDDFNPRCDAVPVANLLTLNYGWMNRSMGRRLNIVPHRITRLLRRWASEYSTGMRVLRRADNSNPVGFYLMYPVAPASEINFSSAPAKGLHLASANTTDPFTLATPGEVDCSAVFVRSWMIDPDYLEQYRTVFLTDAQDTLRKMQQDFPNLCDLHTLIIHPSYEAMALALGFQKVGMQSGRDAQIYWMYQALDRYLLLDIERIFG